MTRKPTFGGRRVAAGIAVCVALVIAALAVDATWLRPLVQHYVRDRAGRQIDFDGLRIGLDAGLQPVVRLRNLRVDNAPWAAARPLIHAATFDLTIAWQSLLGHGMVVPLLVIADADIDLEQQADGLRNWRLADPQNRGPGKVRIRSLQAERSRMRIVNAKQHLEIDLATTPLAAARNLAARPDLPMTQSLRFSGQRGDARFAGAVDASRVLSLFDTGTDFALSGHIESGPANLAIEGLAHDLLQFAGFDADLRLDSTNLRALGDWFGAMPLPALAVAATGRVRKDGPQWAVSGLHARAGRSDLSGSLEFRRRQSDGSRATWAATLASERLDLTEMRPAASTRRAAESKPSAPLDPRRLDDFDGEIDLKVAKLDGVPLGHVGELGGVHAHAALHASRLQISPLTFAVAGGDAAGTVTVDASRSPPEAAVDMQFRGLRLDRLAAMRAGADRPDGGLNLRLALQSRGDSLATWRAATSGHVSATLQHATLPAKMDAQIALDGGEWLRALFQPGRRVAVTCSVADIDFTAGTGRSRRLAIETENVLLNGTAEVDLKRQTFDLVLTPHRKRSALLALDKSVRLSGAFKQAKAGLVASDKTPNAAGCDPAGSR